MPGKLGADFNAAQPSDDDLVKYGARWMRDIKARIKSTLGVLFDLETGQLQDYSVDPAKLKNTTFTKGEGPWNTVYVDPNGLVTDAENVTQQVSANINRVTYLFSGGIGADGSVIPGNSTESPLGVDTEGASSDPGGTVQTYTFTVPDGVTRLLLKIQAAGGGATDQASGGGGGYAEAIVTAAPGDSWLVWIGQGGQGGGTPHGGTTTKFAFGTDKYIKAIGGTKAAGSTGGEGLTPAATGIASVIAFAGGSGQPIPSTYSRFITASVSSVLIATGSKAFSTVAGAGFFPGQTVKVSSLSAPTNFMKGSVATYASTTLTLTVTEIGGSGTFTDWQIFEANSEAESADGGPPGLVSAPGNYGWGGAVSAESGQAGNNGFLIIEYWQ